MSIDEAMNCINKAMVDVMRENINFRIKPFGKDMVADGKETAQKMRLLLDAFRLHINTLESILKDTVELTENIELSIQVDDTKSEYVHMSGSGILVYKDKRFVDKPAPKKKAIKMLDSTDEKRRAITYVQPYNSNLTVLHVNELAFEESFRYYKGGFYFCLGHRNYARVPYVNIIDNKTTNKARSIRCRFGSKEACKRSGYSTRQECFFAHDGETMIKVGYPGRCGQIVDFGNPSSFNFGVSKIGIGDIRTILMYGLNDLFIVMLWLEYHGIKNKIFENLEVA